eukprot:SAG22_NODE_1697_length_3790_cov_1.813601_8_plen_159_part_01
MAAPSLGGSGASGRESGRAAAAMLSTVSVNNQSPMVKDRNGKMMRLPSKVKSDARHNVTIIDTTTEERIRADSPSLQESMRMNGVELRQLVPRMEKDFDDGTAEPAIVKVRFQTFDKVRLELLNMVLETRRDLVQHAAARLGVKSPRWRPAEAGGAPGT